MESIFIQIAAYRDRELPNTIADAIAKASGKYRLVFGVHACHKFPGEVAVDASNAEIRFSESITPDVRGVGASRYRANSHYAGETYYLQTDSHMRFADDWDAKAVDSLKWYQSQGVLKPLLSQYPPNFWYGADGSIEMDSGEFKPTKVDFTERPEDFKRLIPSQRAVLTSPECCYTPSVSAAMVFTLGEFAHIAPNPNVAFWGEELLIAARAFTHGFDLVTLRENLLWHLYVNGQPFEMVGRHHVWNDYPEIWGEIDAASRSHVFAILSSATTGEHALGTERTLQEFGDFAGLNFDSRTIDRTNHA
jgi:hypothetical protein